MNEFMCRLDLGILGYQDVEVSYEADGYKPLGFEVWMHDFPYVGKSSIPGCRLLIQKHLLQEVFSLQVFS